MSQDSESTEARHTYRGRAWWQYVIGLGLIGTCAYLAYARVTSNNLYPIKPREIRVSAKMRPSDVVPCSPGELAGCNLLLVTFDTTRADRIGCYGHDKIRTYALDKLAAEGVLFSRAMAPAPTTLPSHASLLTGLYPYHHGARANGLYRLENKYETLAEVLANSGYVTGAVVSASVLEAQFGIDQGFGDYLDELEVDEDDERVHGQIIAERRGDKTVEFGADWLREHANDQFFLWVHFYDPHYPYEAPEPGDANPYDAEIEFTDAQLGRLMNLVDDLGLTDKTLVVVAADHGEGLGQHNESQHSCLIYESTMHVPMIMRCGTRLGGGMHVDRLVSLVDVMPTVLNMLGVDVPERLDGVDLTQPPSDRRFVFIETLQGLADHGWAALLGVADQSMKYIYGPTDELYDLTNDPFENNDLSDSRSQVVADLKRQLQAFYGEDLDQAASVEATHQLDPQQLAKLQSLGYLSGVGQEMPPPGERPHPKEMLPLYEQVHAAIALEKTKGLDQSISQLEKITRRHPDFFSGHLFLGEAYAKRDDFEKAEAALQRSLEIRPTRPEPWRALAQLKNRQKQTEEAISLYREAVKCNPNNYHVLKELGRLLTQRGEYNEATELLNAGLKIWPRDDALPDLVVDNMLVLERTDEAISLLQGLLDTHPAAPMLRNALSRLLIVKQDYAAAVDVLREGVKLAPGSAKLANNLAYLLVTAPDESVRDAYQAAVMMERICHDTGYQDPRYLHTLSVVYSALGRLREAISIAEKARSIASASENPEFVQLAPSIGVTLERFRTLLEQGYDVSKRYTRLREHADEEGQVPGSEADDGPSAAGESNDQADDMGGADEDSPGQSQTEADESQDEGKDENEVSTETAIDR